MLFWHKFLFSNSNKLTNQMQQFYKFITWRFVSLNMFRVSPRPSSGAYNCITSTVNPEAVNAVVSSWWWLWKHLKHVELNKMSSDKLVKVLHLVGWFIWIVWWYTDLPIAWWCTDLPIVWWCTDLPMSNCYSAIKFKNIW